MIKKLTLYIETSVFGFYYDDKIINKEKRESVRKLFKQISLGYFSGAFISPVTMAELSNAPESLRNRLLSLVEQHNLKEIEADNTEIDKLVECYKKGIKAFKRWQNDARHIATATISGVDVLVTLNCEHIVNEQTIRKVRLINISEGYTKELDIRKPEEVIIYEN